MAWAYRASACVSDVSLLSQAHSRRRKSKTERRTFHAAVACARTLQRTARTRHRARLTAARLMRERRSRAAGWQAHRHRTPPPSSSPSSTGSIPGQTASHGPIGRTCTQPPWWMCCSRPLSFSTTKARRGNCTMRALNSHRHPPLQPAACRPAAGGKPPGRSSRCPRSSARRACTVPPCGCWLIRAT